jgi:signal transduction histidine kinase
MADQAVPLDARALTAEAVRRAAPVVVDDATTSPLIDPARRQLTGARAALAVPLPARERVIGALLVIGTRGPRAFSTDEIAVAEALAAQAAVAIGNARLYEAEQRARAEAQAAVRLREEFLGIASHELKTPLTIMKGYVQVLTRRAGQRDLSAARLSSIYDALGRQVQRLEALVASLLDTARVQQGRLVLERRPADLVEIAQQVLARFDDSPELTEQHRLTLAADGPVEGVWDADRLDQVLTNLISNALKYSPAGGEVRITLRQVDDEAEMTVSDQGIGIPADEQAQLFQPFYRGTSHLPHGIKGVGLGLYLSGRIVDRHGGRITIASAPEGGTIFTVRLPLRTRQAAASRRP